MSGDGELIRPAAAARRLGISYDTLVKYVDAGLVPAVRLPTGERRIARADLEATLESWRTQPVAQA